MYQQKIVIATRESPLALRQAEWVKDELLGLYPNLGVEILGMGTTADKMWNMPVGEMGGKGLFVKELEEALLQGRADIAVHSMKDVPMDLPLGLCLAAISKREDPRDVLVSDYASWKELPKGALVGTSSLRRQIQLSKLRPDLKMQALRGNIHTRLKRLDDKELDALVLAAAGLKRLQLHGRVMAYFSQDELMPPAGQGALGIECREEDTKVHNLVQALGDPSTSFCVMAERAMCRHLGGGCMIPIGSYAEIEAGMIVLHAFVSNGNGSRLLRASGKAKPIDAEKLGIEVAEALMKKGAISLLKEFKQ